MFKHLFVGFYFLYSISCNFAAAAQVEEHELAAPAPIEYFVLPAPLQETAREFKKEFNGISLHLPQTNPFKKYIEWIVYQDGIGVTEREQEIYFIRDLQQRRGFERYVGFIETADATTNFTADAEAQLFRQTTASAFNQLSLYENPFARFVMGLIHVQGIGQPVDLALGLSYLNAACQFNHKGERILARPAPYRRALEFLMKNQQAFAQLREMPDSNIVDDEIRYLDNPLVRLNTFLEDRQSSDTLLSPLELQDLENCLTLFPDTRTIDRQRKLYLDLTDSFFKALKEEKGTAAVSICAGEIVTASFKLIPFAYVTTILGLNIINGFEFTSNQYLTAVFTGAIVSSINTTIHLTESLRTFVTAIRSKMKSARIAPGAWTDWSDEVLMQEARLISLYVTLFKEHKETNKIITNKIIKFLRKQTLDSNPSLAEVIKGDIDTIFL